VGKERFARALHELSGRKGEFVPLNAAGLDDSFFSDLLFGHRPGAFTGANTPLEGLIERARGGTLFLDEIGELSVSSQIKLLRTIELGEYYPLGSDALKLSSARFIVATNRDLERAMEEGAFRKDLFFRLRSHRLHIPPLRERLEDLPLLVEHFIARAAEELGKEAPLQSAELCSSLSAYPFLGNVRELESMVFEAVNADRKGVLTSIDFAHLLCSPRSGAEQRGSGLRFPDPLPSLREVSELLIDEALRRAKGNQAQAARLIGVSPQAISKRLAMRREKAQSDGSAARSSASKMGARRPQSEAQWRQKRLI
jgi:DNA-binding NtrC family response regulator